MTLLPAFTRGRSLSRPRTGLIAGARRYAAACLLPWMTACYTYVPVRDSSPTPGSEVALGVSDRGRVALGPLVGPGAQRLTGRVVAVTDSTYELAVTSIVYVNSPEAARWNGEGVRVPRDVVAGLQERRLSRSRTWMTIGIAAAAAVALSMVGIYGLGGDDSPDRLPPGGGEPQ